VAIDRIVLPIIIFRFLGRELRRILFAQAQVVPAYSPINMWTFSKFRGCCSLGKPLSKTPPPVLAQIQRPDTSYKLLNCIPSFVRSARFLNSPERHVIAITTAKYQKCSGFSNQFLVGWDQGRVQSVDSEPEQIWRNGSVSYNAENDRSRIVTPNIGILGGSRGSDDWKQGPFTEDMLEDPYSMMSSLHKCYTATCIVEMQKQTPQEGAQVPSFQT